MRNNSSTVLFIHASSGLYGADVSLLQLVSALDRDRFRAVVVVPYDGPLVPYLQEVGAEVIVYSNLPVLRRQYMNARGLFHLAVAFLTSVPWLVDLVYKRNVALVHGNTLATALAGLATKLAGRPQIWHTREIILRPRIIASVLATLSSAVSTLVIANTQTTANYYVHTRFATSTPVRVVHNGFDASRLRKHPKTALRSSAGAGPNDIVFTLIGRINRGKGHSVFLDAAEHLVEEFKDVRFMIVGDSFAGQEHLSKAVDQRIESSDALRGRAVRLPHIAEVGSVYKASDVIVVPSIEPESFGNVAAEAMAMGLPVIASRIGGLPEVVEAPRTGLLVDPGDPTSLLAAMRELSASPSRRTEMGRKGRERFERYFHVDRYVEELEQLYNDIIKYGRKGTFTGST